MTDVPPISIFLFALIAVLFALAVLALRAAPRAWANRSLAAGVLAVAVWVLGIGGLQTGGRVGLWLGVAFVGASFIPAVFLLLLRHYPMTTLFPSSATLIASFALAAVFAGSAVATPLLFSQPRLVAGVLAREPGPLYPAFGAYYVLSWALALVVLVRKWRLATPRQRSHLRYFGSGVMLSGLGGATTNLIIPSLTGSSAYSWLGPCFLVPFVVFAAHAIFRHHLMDLRLVLHRPLLLGVASVLALTPLLLVLAVVVTPGDGHARLDGSAVALLLLAGLSIPLVRDACSRLLDRYFYRTRADYRRTVRESSALLTRGQTVRSLMDTLARHVRAATHPEGVAIYLLQGHAMSRSVVHVTGDGRFAAPAAVPAPVLESLRTTAGGPVERRAEHAGHRGRPSLDAILDELNWSVVMPLRSADTVIGAIALAPKRSGDPYYPHDLDLLATLANQAGIAVKNAQLNAEVVLANEYVESIVATINSGVVAIGAEGRVTLFNRAAAQLTGLRADDVRLQPSSVLPACLGEPLARAMADGRAATYPEIALPGDAEPRPAICTVSPLRDTAGTVLGSVAVFSDLTPLRELEIERRRRERLEYFQQLASGLAHEIKNPLVSIKTFVQLVPYRLDDPRWLEEFSRVAHREIERLERLLQRVATLGRGSERPQCPVDLRLPIREALELVQPEFAERRIRVEVRLGEREQIILGDHDELKQLAHNLLINALQHTPVDGELAVELNAREDCAVLAVSDTGPGVPPEMLERIFDPFVTTRKHGTGLGLAICTGIAAAHRARLGAANRATGGAVFSVEFPLAARVTAPTAR